MHRRQRIEIYIEYDDEEATDFEDMVMVECMKVARAVSDYDIAGKFNTISKDQKRGVIVRTRFEAYDYENRFPPGLTDKDIDPMIA